MIRIDLIRQNSNHPSRTACEVDGHRYETAGSAPVYKIVTLLWLHGHGGEDYEVWDDLDPFGKPGGLAMRGRIRNWALLVKRKLNFTRKAKPDSYFMSDEREVIVRAAGTVVDLAEIPAASGFPGAVCVTRPSDGPDPLGDRRPLYGRCHRPGTKGSLNPRLGAPHALHLLPIHRG